MTFGIAPARAETGYGWLELAPWHFLWNAGIFLFTIQSLAAAFLQHAPKVLAPVDAAVRAGRTGTAT